MTEIQQRYDRDEVRERTDLLALIGQYVALKKRGGRFTGLCPFHQEKSPSFGVDPQKGLWHCFGCGKGGDAFNFLMQIEHLSFPEAVERLAERAGVRPRETFEAPQRKEERDFLYEINAVTAAAFSAALRGKAGAAARGYLENRGITAEQAARFGLGYAPPGWDALLKHLQQRGFSAEIMAKAGVALARSSGEGYIDRFRHRLMIPIYDRQGRVVAFGGRALAKEDNPKYLNTAETPVFHKSRTLYALNLAAETIHKRGRVIITEGYFDVIACHLAGFTEAVATLGTALGEEHVQILRRLVEQVYLVFDADSAGVNAALRSQALFRAAGVEVRIARLPAGHDPDTLLREEGAEAFERCLTEALSPVEFELERLVAQHPANDAEGRLRLFRAAAKVLQPLPKLDRAEYAARLIDRSLGGQSNITELQQAMLAEVAALDRAGHRQGAPQEPSAPAPASTDVPLERELLAAMVQNAEFAQRVVEQAPSEAFTQERHRELFDSFRELSAQGKELAVKNIITDDEAVARLVAELAIREMTFLHEVSPGVKSWVEKHATTLEVRLDHLLESFIAAYRKRSVVPTDFSLDDRETLEQFQKMSRERSRAASKKIFSEEK